MSNETEAAERELAASQIEVWWDGGQQLWTIQHTDGRGNQIGDVDHAPQKATAVQRANQRGADIGCKVLIKSRADG